MNAIHPLFQLKRNYDFHCCCHESAQYIVRLLCGLWLDYYYFMIIRYFGTAIVFDRCVDDFQFRRQLSLSFCFSTSIDERGVERELLTEYTTTQVNPIN